MMDFLKEPEVPPAEFFSLVDDGMHGLIRFAALHAAGSLQIFDQLENKAATLTELSIRTRIDERRLLPLMNILIQSGLVANEKGRYGNTRLASTYLASKSPYCQKYYLHKNAMFLETIWACLPERLIGSPLVYPQERFFRDLAIPAMAENALTGRLQRTIREIAAIPRFASARKMVDLGGGHGLYAIALASLNQDLEAWIFDLPSITPLAERCIRRWNAARVSTISGNFFSDDIGSGYDLVLSSSNPSGKSIGLVPKISNAMNEGGIFVNVQSDPVDHDDAYRALEWQLWTLDNEEKGKNDYTREKPFMTVEYRSAMEASSLRIVLEKEIRDDYHRDSSVRMVIAEKKTG